MQKDIKAASLFAVMTVGAKNCEAYSTKYIATYSEKLNATMRTKFNIAMIQT